MVIIQKRVGQLGNQLFALAHFTAAAIENDYRVLCPCFEHCLGEFPNINTNRNLKFLRARRRMNRLLHGFFKFCASRCSNLTVVAENWIPPGGNPLGSSRPTPFRKGVVEANRCQRRFLRMDCNGRPIADCTGLIEIMPKPLNVDWLAVRVLAVAEGVREAARQMGIREDAVRQCSKHEDWMASPKTAAQRALAKPVNAFHALAN